MLPKCCAVGLLLLGATVGALGQGQVVFNNRVLGSVIAPVYGPEPADPTLVKQGNTSTGLPKGTQTYGGALLAGSGFTAQLFGGPTNALPENLRPLLPLSSFRTADLSGFVVAPLNAVNVGGVPEGSRARLQLRVWDNRNGTITNWLQVLDDPTVLRGQSLPFISQPLGGAYVIPINLDGLQSFNLALGQQPPGRLRLNFQSIDTPPPPGYLPDVGLAYIERDSGYAYGWQVDNTAGARYQPAANVPDDRYASSLLMQSDSTWEIAVTNGVYRVHVVAGDAANLAAVYRIEVEGLLAVHGTPVLGNNWIEGTVVVPVNDGRLTVRSAAGSFANRLCFLEIEPIQPPQLLTPAALAPEGFPLRFTGEAAVKYRILGSSDFLSWADLGAPTTGNSNEFNFVDTAATGFSTRFYRAAIAVPPPVIQVYSNDFAAAAGPEWSATTLSVTPAGARQFLGPFGHSTTRLNLSGLPPHTKMTLTCDLLVLQSWNGSNSTNGPDTWGLNVTGGPVLLSTTFQGATTNATLRQAYPGPFPGSAFPACTGASEIGTLGYNPGGDAVYHLSYTFPHSANAVELNFVGGTTEALSDESWGLDNVVVSVQDDPYD